MKMKIGYQKMVLLTLTMALFFSTAYAEINPYVVLDGPSRIEVGQTAQYTVSTMGGSDSGYTWKLLYSSMESKDCTFADGYLTVMSPGTVGIHVKGNDIGVYAEMNVDIPSEGSSFVGITGPDKVAIGSKGSFSATAHGFSAGDVAWLITSPWPYSNIATINQLTGELQGIGEGMVTLCAVDKTSGRMGERNVRIFSAEKMQPRVSVFSAVTLFGEFATSLTISGDVPASVSLYIALDINGTLYYLPDLGPSFKAFRTGPTKTFNERVVTIPFDSIPSGTYTIYSYAVLMDSAFHYVGEMAKSGPVDISIQRK